ncbi:hypothetical protein COC46_18720 [Bacillus sp. AFS041924]|nr:hypothetical protein COC46_18720 [Bacillus sp. AFS041924]
MNIKTERLMCVMILKQWPRTALHFNLHLAAIKKDLKHIFFDFASFLFLIFINFIHMKTGREGHIISKQGK